ASAEAGVDFVSVGAITHSAPAIDIALDVELTRGTPRTRLGARRVLPAPAKPRATKAAKATKAPKAARSTKAATTAKLPARKSRS
ncbi:MAG: hypothetical protein ABIT01_00480, partial [Thermoanaerobaculia bacterium]